MKIPSSFGRRRPRIEIIPLIDIMFFLLATFVMVSLSMIKNRGIPVQLPAASSAIRPERHLYATITVTERGDLYLDKKPVDLKTLTFLLTRMKSDAADLQVFIQGDERAPLGSVTGVLDEVRLLGITKVAIQTRGGPESKQPLPPHASGR